MRRRFYVVKSGDGFYVSEPFPGTFELTSDYVCARRFKKEHANLLAGTMNEDGWDAQVMPVIHVPARQKLSLVQGGRSA